MTSYPIFKEFAKIMQFQDIKYEVLSKNIYYLQDEREHVLNYYSLIDQMIKGLLPIKKDEELYQVLLTIHEKGLHREFKNEIIKFYLNQGMRMPKEVYIIDGNLHLPVNSEMRVLPIELKLTKNVEINLYDLEISVN